MDGVKAKNFIILVLLLVNLTLLGLVVTDGVRAAAARRETLRGTAAILAENGIAVSDGADLALRALPVLHVTRDLEQELANVSRVLGEAGVTDRGGNIMRYVGARGQGEFRGTGSFSILMNEGEVPTGDDAVATARRFAGRLGLELLEGEGSAWSDVENGSGTVELYGRAGGARILNCRLTFSFSSGSLNLVTGSRPLDTAREDAAAGALDVPTVLMRFLALVRSEGHVCSELRQLELCYLLSASASGEGTLTPVWRLVTDTGEFYINGITGRNESIS